MIRNMVLCILLVSFLSGCAGADWGDYTQSVDTTNARSASMITAYLEKRAQNDQTIMASMLSGGTPETRAANQMAVMMYGMLQNQQDRELLSTYAPKYVSKPTTNADIGMAVTTNLLPTIVKWGVGAYLGNELINGLQTTSTVVGAGASYNQGTGSSVVNNQGTTGSGSYNPPIESGTTTVQSSASATTLPVTVGTP